jgi:hypothetical protein
LVALTEAALLPLWEEGERAGELGREALLLAAAAPKLAGDDPAELTFGQRNAALLALHARAFGERLDGFVCCPACGEALEVSLGEAEVRALLAAEPTLGEDHLAIDGFELRLRPVTCADLEVASGAADADGARRVLIERCVLAARLGGDVVEPNALPEDVVAALASRLAALDPQAEISLAVSCPECEHVWRADLDAASFLWRRISLAARELLEEVHVLASAYGWTEAEIFALSRRRRRAYLELALS